MGGGGRADGRDAFGFSLDEDEKKAAARSTRSSSSSLSSLAPLGSGSLKPPSSGLGSLTSLSGASRPSAAAAAPSSFDLDDGFDALLSADTKPAASSSASSTAAKKPSKEKRSYDSGSDDEDSAARKKDKKKKSKKKDDAPLPSEKEDKSRRALPTRKMPAARPSTAPSEFDDDSLFGIKKEPSVTTSQANPRRSSMSKSQSIREHGNWDEEGEEDDAEGDAAGGAERHEYSTTKSAESTARKVTAAMAAKEKRDQEAYEKQQQPPPQSFLPEPLAVPLKEDPAPAPRTFGRPRATSGAAAPSSTAAAPAASTSAAPAPNSTPSPQASFLPTAAPPTTFHMPGGDDEPVVEEKKPIITAAKPATASSTSSIAHPPATAASSSSHFDDSDALPLEEGPPAVSPSLHPSSSSPAQAAPMSPDRGSADPFGGLEGDPMDEIDEKQGNCEWKETGFIELRLCSALC
jgi:hypothetical protein